MLEEIFLMLWGVISWCGYSFGYRSDVESVWSRFELRLNLKKGFGIGIKDFCLLLEVRVFIDCEAKNLIHFWC